MCSILMATMHTTTDPHTRELPDSSQHPKSPDGVTFALVKLGGRNTDPPSATFHDLRQDQHLFSKVHGYTYLRDESAVQSSEGRYVSRAVSKLSFFSERLSCRQITPHDTRKEAKFTFPMVQIGPDAFVSQYTTKANKHMVNVFPKLSFRYSNGFAASHHVHARNIRPSGSQESRPGSVCFSTGMCLFSEALVLSLKDRKDAKARVEWTLYELETMIRLASMIADVIGLIRVDGASPTPPISVYVDLPDVQYYWIAFEQLQRGSVTGRDVRNWIKAVDTRRDEMWARLRDLIQKMLHARDLAPVDIHLAEGTASLRDLLKTGLRCGQCPSVDQSLFTLRTKGPQAHSWNEFMEHVDETSMPKTSEDLSHLIHIYNTIKPALPRLRDTTTQPDPLTPVLPLLLIVVDDIAEWRIFDGAESYLRGRRTMLYHNTEVHVVGLFPLQKVFVKDDERSSLWSRCPGSLLRIDNIDSLQTPGKVVERIYERTQG